MNNDGLKALVGLASLGAGAGALLSLVFGFNVATGFFSGFFLVVLVLFLLALLSK